MFIKKKLAVLIALVSILTLLSISTVESHDPSITQTDAPSMGPYDIAVLPLEDVPDPGPEVYRNIFPPSADYLYAQAEVLRVLKDPRTIPLDRFLYYRDSREQTQYIYYRDPQVRSVYEERNQLLEQVVSHPEADLILDRFKDEPHSAVAVYVRTTGAYMEREYTFDDDPDNPVIEIINQLDPFYIRDPILDYEMQYHYSLSTNESTHYYFDWSPWSYLAVSDTESDLAFPCMPQRVLDIGDPCANPETGEMIDPATYLPPKPWYAYTDNQIQEGEIREGWLLCLAPDVPIEEIELVQQRGQGYRGETQFSTDVESLVWTTLNIKPMGEWHLLPDMEVVAWNGPVADRLADFNALDLHDVYRGDVWISMASAFTNDAPLGLEDAAFAGVSIQLQFEGIDDLLQTWEYVALKEWLSLEFCFDRKLSDCVKADQHFEPDGTMIEVSNACPDESADCPDTHQIETTGFFNSVLLYSPGTWIEAPILLEDHSKAGIDILLVGLESRSGVLQTNREVPGRTLAWCLEPQLISIPVLTTHTICMNEQVDCVAENTIFMRHSPCELPRFHCHDPETGEEITGPKLLTDPPSFDGPIPIVPFGQSAFGIRILEVRFLDGILLSPHLINTLDYVFENPDDSFENVQFLFVDLEVEGYSGGKGLFQELDGGVLVSEGGYGQRVVFSDSGPNISIGSTHITQLRRVKSNISLVFTVSYGIKRDKLILINISHSESGGPAFELPLNE